jgi:hypothetical protein
LDPNLTDITVLLDRSGSMESIRNDMVGAMNAFLDAQRALPGRTTFTLATFDTRYEVVRKAADLADVPPLTAADLVPRGGTALLDSMARCIRETGDRLGAIPEAARPGKVLFAIVTDGEENASREHTRSRPLSPRLRRPTGSSRLAPSTSAGNPTPRRRDATSSASWSTAPPGCPLPGSRGRREPGREARPSRMPTMGCDAVSHDLAGLATPSSGSARCDSRGRRGCRCRSGPGPAPDERRTARPRSGPRRRPQGELHAAARTGGAGRSRPFLRVLSLRRIRAPIEDGPPGRRAAGAAGNRRES